MMFLNTLDNSAIIIIMIFDDENLQKYILNYYSQKYQLKFLKGLKDYKQTTQPKSIRYIIQNQIYVLSNKFIILEVCKLNINILMIQIMI